METTKKAYNHLLLVVDGFTKFVYLYPMKSTNASAVIDCLENQSSIFINPRRIITDRVAALISQVFKDYFTEDNIQHLLIATGVPLGNGQVKRIYKIAVPLLAKLCNGNPMNWYRHVRRVQMLINSNVPSNTQVSTFKPLTGVEMRLPDYPDLR